MLEGLTPPVNAALCLVGRKAAELDENDNRILQESIDNPLWSTTALTAALTERGFVVGETALRKHRKMECACARAA